MRPFVEATRHGPYREVMPSVDDRDDLVDLAAEVTRLRDAMLHAERERSDEIEAAHPLHRRSAANLVHYVELRNHDIRHLQTQLGLLGLSSLGRSESSVSGDDRGGACRDRRPAGIRRAVDGSQV